MCVSGVMSGAHVRCVSCACQVHVSDVCVRHMCQVCFRCACQVCESGIHASQMHVSGVCPVCCQLHVSCVSGTCVR